MFTPIWYFFFQVIPLKNDVFSEGLFVVLPDFSSKKVIP